MVFDFDGKTGAALYTTDYVLGRGDVAACGDKYGNRVDRFLAAVAFLDGKHVYNTKGEIIHDSINGRWTCNFAIWWDGDLLRELLDHKAIYKYVPAKNQFDRKMKFEGCSFNNFTKLTPSLQADILGDWREEVVTRTSDNEWLRIYVSPYKTKHRMNCLMQDRTYRISVATENVGYNQPPEPGFYIGPDATGYLR